MPKRGVIKIATMKIIMTILILILLARIVVLTVDFYLKKKILKVSEKFISNINELESNISNLAKEKKCTVKEIRKQFDETITLLELDEISNYKENSLTNLELVINDIVKENYRIIKNELNNSSLKNLFVRGNERVIKKIILVIINNLENENIILSTEKSNGKVIVTLWDENKSCNYNLIRLINNVNGSTEINNKDTIIIKKIMEAYKIKILLEGRVNSGTKVIMRFN